MVKYLSVGSPSDSRDASSSYPFSPRAQCCSVKKSRSILITHNSAIFINICHSEILICRQVLLTTLALRGSLSSRDLYFRALLYLTPEILTMEDNNPNISKAPCVNNYQLEQ
jgi:hypothetical protein